MEIFSFDFYIFQKINQFAGNWHWLDLTSIFFAKYVGYILIFLLFLFLLKNWKKYWRMVFWAFFSAVLSKFIICELIRFIWKRPRPFVENSVHLLLSHSPTPSFPSDHAAFYFALSTIVYFYNKKAGTLFLVASFFIGLARIFCGLHWPLDILGGAVIGVFSGWISFSLSKNF